MTGLPSFVFDTADYAETDRFDAVADLWRNYLTFNFGSTTTGEFFLKSRIWWLNDCTFVHSVAAPLSCRRPPPPDQETLISVSFLRQGRQAYLVNGAPRVQAADAIHISRHSDQTFRHGHTDSEIFILYVPAIRIGLLPGQEFPDRTLPVKSPLGAMIRSMLLDLPTSLSTCTPEEGAMLADSLCAFLEPVLRDPANGPTASAADFRRAAIKRYIEENIRDFALDAERLCTVFAMSRPALYRHFKEDGGVMAYIAKRRTHHIYAELSRSSARWGLIRSVAERFGFHDMTQFTRTFRKHMGVTPGDIVGSAIPAIPYLHDAGGSDQSGDSLFPLVFSQPAEITDAPQPDR